MSRHHVYLAGPISGCSYKGCVDWRKAAIEELAMYGIHGVSPMRGKEYLSHLSNISPDGTDYAHLGVLSLPRGVITRDRFDTMRSSVVLMNLLGAERVSIGTMMELAWADAARIPVVCAMEATGNVHEHMMVNEAIGYKVPTLDEALHIVKAMLHE